MKKNISPYFEYLGAKIMDVEGKFDDVGHLVQRVCGSQG